MDAHTVDVLGIAIKLNVLNDTGEGGEISKGILRDLAAAGCFAAATRRRLTMARRTRKRRAIGTGASALTWACCAPASCC